MMIDAKQIILITRPLIIFKNQSVHFFNIFKIEMIFIKSRCVYYET